MISVHLHPWARGHFLPAFVEWSRESSTSQCYVLCAPNPSTKARVRRSGAPSYDCFCPLRKPLLGSWPAQALIDGRNTTTTTTTMHSTSNWRPKGFLGPLIGSYLRSADKTILLLNTTVVPSQGRRSGYGIASHREPV